MNEPIKTIPLTVVGEKQLGGDKIARNRAVFDESPILRKPAWIRVRIPPGNAVARLKSKLRENSSCMPRQIPIRGLPLYDASQTTLSRPFFASFSRASRKAPTPGKMRRSASRMTVSSPLTTASSPSAFSELLSEKRLPTP